MEAECDMCGQNIAKYSCKHCGRKLCENHYNAKIGICLGCMSKITGS